jgi:hypothetical protein
MIQLLLQRGMSAGSERKKTQKLCRKAWFIQKNWGSWSFLLGKILFPMGTQCWKFPSCPPLDFEPVKTPYYCDAFSLFTIESMVNNSPDSPIVCTKKLEFNQPTVAWHEKLEDNPEASTINGEESNLKVPLTPRVECGPFFFTTVEYVQLLTYSNPCFSKHRMDYNTATQIDIKCQLWKRNFEKQKKKGKKIEPSPSQL